MDQISTFEDSQSVMGCSKLSENMGNYHLLIRCNSFSDNLCPTIISRSWVSLGVRTFDISFVFLLLLSIAPFFTPLIFVDSTSLVNLIISYT